MSSPMMELPEHCPIDVNAEGQGPETNPELIVATVCWCGVDGCQLYKEAGDRE